MKEGEIRSMGQVQEAVREKFNPEWREQHEMHKKILAEMGGEPGNPIAALIRLKREGRSEARRRRKL